jgi:putative ABC transport system permease protein
MSNQCFVHAPKQRVELSVPCEGCWGSSSSSSTSEPDDTLIIPVSTGTERIFGGTSLNSVSSIALQARSSADLTPAYQEADHLLHVLTPIVSVLASI